MIWFNFTITNPFCNRFKIIKSVSTQLTRNKNAEANIYRTANIITVSLEVTTGRSHAGIRLEAGIAGYQCELHIYDSRHWDHLNNCWEVHGKSN